MGSQRRISPLLPPDPERYNDRRARNVDTALKAFQHATDADDEDVLADLPTNIMHWCDRHSVEI